jgi:hypothetical protein
VIDVFAEWAPIYRDCAYWPRPITPGTKACKMPGWQTPDPELEPRVLETRPKTHASDGIGLLLGSPFPDGTVLGALDIDNDDYVRVARTLLHQPPCGRIGARGILFFVRIKGDTAYRELKIKAENGRPAVKVGELLVARRLAVIPPTIHPDTHAPYTWVGRALHEIAYTDLPLLEA